MSNDDSKTRLQNLYAARIAAAKAALGNACACCGTTTGPLEFDHVYSRRSHGGAVVGTLYQTPKALAAELARVQLLCAAVCHPAKSLVEGLVAGGVCGAENDTAAK